MVGWSYSQSVAAVLATAYRLYVHCLWHEQRCCCCSMRLVVLYKCYMPLSLRLPLLGNSWFYREWWWWLFHQSVSAQRQQLNGRQEPGDLLVADADVAGDHVDGHDDSDDAAARGARPAADRAESILLPRRERGHLSPTPTDDLPLANPARKKVCGKWNWFCWPGAGGVGRVVLKLAV